MRALLIGFGDLAQRLAPRLLASQWEVTGLRRSRAEVAGVAMMAGDCRDPQLLDAALIGQDLVVVSLTPATFTEEAYRETYEDSAHQIAAALARQARKPRYLLWVSSTSVYGQCRGEWVDEYSDTQPSGFSGRCLLAAEAQIALAPVATTVVRFSGIYGPGRTRMVEQVRAGHCAPATPVQWTNRIHSDDCAAVLHHLATLAIAEAPVAPLYIGTDCEPVPLHEVHQWLAAQLGATPHPRAESAAPRRGNRRCSNRLLLASGYRFIYPSFREGYAAGLVD